MKNKIRNISLNWDTIKNSVNSNLINFLRLKDIEDFFDYEVIAIERGGVMVASLMQYACDDNTTFKVLKKPRNAEDTLVLWKNEIKSMNLNPLKNILVIDDINDTGKTFLEFEAAFKLAGLKNNVEYFPLFERYSTKFENTICWNKIIHDEYVIFPWERLISWDLIQKLNQEPEIDI